MIIILISIDTTLLQANNALDYNQYFTHISILIVSILWGRYYLFFIVIKFIGVTLVYKII